MIRSDEEIQGMVWPCVLRDINALIVMSGPKAYPAARNKTLSYCRLFMKFSSGSSASRRYIDCEFVSGR